MANSAAFDQLNADLDQLAADLSAKLTAVSAAIQALKDQIAAGGTVTEQQLTDLDNKVKAIDSTVTTFMTTP